MSWQIPYWLGSADRKLYWDPSTNSKKHIEIPHKSFFYWVAFPKLNSGVCVPTGQRNSIQCLKQFRWTACDVFPVPFTTKLFSFPQGYRKRQLVKGSTSIKERFGERFNWRKSNSQKQKGSGGEFRNVFRPGGEKYRSHDIMFRLDSENARKMPS